MSAKHTPTPWMKGDYTATEKFKAISEHECLCREDGSLIAVFGPKGDPQSIIDRDAAGRAVNAYDANQKTIEGLLDLIAIALLDHQHVEPHHSDLCNLCVKMEEAIDQGEKQP